MRGKIKGLVYAVITITVISQVAFLVPRKVSAQTDQLTTYTAWFGSGGGTGTCSGVPITITTDKTPPQVTISTGQPNCNGTGYTGPTLTFKLTNVDSTYTSYGYFGHGIGIGALIGSNVTWTIFQAYQSDGKVVPGLFLIGDNKGPNWTIRYQSAGENLDTNSFPENENLLTLNMLDDKDTPGVTPNNTYQVIYRYLYNEPVSNSDCAGGTAFITGPSQTNKTITETGGNLSVINSDCLNIESTGWAKYWGATPTAQSGLSNNSDCTLAKIFTDTFDIGHIIQTMSNCIYTTLIDPMLNWATDKVIQASGISYLQIPTNYSFPIEQTAGEKNSRWVNGETYSYVV